MDASSAERIARLHLALAGGDSARFADREQIEAAAQIEARWPGTGRQFAAAYAFHSRAARRAAESGTAGILFGASGFPGAVPLHAEAVQAVPGTRVVYADPSANAAYLNGELLAGPGVAAVRASVRDPACLMALPEVKALGSPVQLHLQLCFHFWPQELCRELTGWYAGYLRENAPGSTLAVSWWCPDGTRAGREFLGALADAAAWPVFGHSLAAVSAWLRDAGLGATGPGAADVRAHVRPWAAWAALAVRSPGRVAAAVARVR